jgi:hypothetical protein
MSVTYQSTKTTGFAVGSTVTIDKPTSLAVGDLMVAFLQASTAEIGGDWNTLSGWTRTVAGSQRTTYLSAYGITASMRKIADSSDVAASNFTFTYNSTRFLAGAIMRFSSNSPSNPTGTPSENTGLIPDVANTMLLMLCNASSSSGGGATISNYAIANNNPTWTETFQLQPGGVNACGFSAAYGNYTPTTTTGNPSVSVSDSSPDVDIILVDLRPLTSINETLDVVTLAANPITPTATGGTTMTLGVVSMITSAIDFLFAGQAKFSSQQRSSSPTFSNQTKHSVSFSNQTKNTMVGVSNEIKN